MLVLSRKVGQSINVGDGIRITVVRARGNQLRIGIDAPPGIDIVRTELAETLARCEKHGQQHMPIVRDRKP